MRSRLRKPIRDVLLALLAFVLIVSIYMLIDGSRLRVPDWHAGPICGVMHGQVDFFPPLLIVNLGSYREIMFFKGSTVVRCGGTYLDFGMNGVILLGAVAALGLIVGMLPACRHRSSEKGKANKASHATSEPAPGADSSAREG